MWRKTLLGMLIAAIAMPVIALQSASAITISPVLVELDLEPGDTMVSSIKVTNETDASETYYPVARDFVAGDEAGAPVFTDTAARSMSKWITWHQASLTVAPGKTEFAAFTIGVPETASPGGYSVGLLMQTAPPSVSEGVGAVAVVGTLLLVNVEGTVVEKASVAEFTAEPDSATSLPVNFKVRFNNEGTTNLKPSGVIRVTNMFGGTAGVVPVNAEGGNVLPSSTRAFDATWAKANLSEDASELVQEWQNFGFGPYTATLIMNYGDGNQVVTATTNFMVMPWLLVVLFLILVVILVLLVNQYNKWLIKTYAKRK